MPYDTVVVTDFADLECEASAKSVAVCATREQQQKYCFHEKLRLDCLGFFHYNRGMLGRSLNADKHSPASSARSTKRRVRGDASVSGSFQFPLTDREATAFMSK